MKRDKKKELKEQIFILNSTESKLLSEDDMN